MEPTKLDKLFAAKAVLKTVEAKVKQLEAECKAELIDSGIYGTLRSPYFGKDAGYICVNQGKESKTAWRTYLADKEAALDWVDEEHPDCEGFARANLELFCNWWLESTGECIDGFVRMEYETEPTEPTVRLTVKEKVVMERLETEGMLEGVGLHLLGDGE